MKIDTNESAGALTGNPGDRLPGGLGLRTPWTSALTLLTALLAFPAYAAAQPPAPVFKTLHSFTGQPGDGALPYGVIIGSGGVLYGITSSGGSANDGTVYSMTPPASAAGSWTYTTIYNFQTSASPDALVAGPGGVLYGTTYLGGTFRSGSVFSLTPPASSGGAWSYTDLYDFTDGSDGGFPNVLTLTGGVLYGTALDGGDSNGGAVFSLHPPSSPRGAWTEAVLYSFPAGVNHAVPDCLLVGAGGVLYGATQSGGSSSLGSVFSLTPPDSSGGPWTYTEIYDFTADGGARVPSGLAIGSGGVLYGASTVGGTGVCNLGLGCGTLFSLTPPASTGGAWTEAVLYNFAGRGDGAYPIGSLVIGSGGVVYGATGGGNSKSGQVYSLTPPASPSGAWTKTLLHHFATKSPGGDYPDSGVAIGGGGLLYGATAGGGTASDGTVFQLKP